MESASKDLQDVRVSTVVNYKIDPLKVRELFEQYRTEENFEEQVLKPIIKKEIKETTSLYTAEELVTKRAEYNSVIDSTLTENFTGVGVIFEQSNITYLAFSESFNKAIEAACNWVETNSSWNETLIIVTADHETGYLVGPGSNVKVNDSDVDLWKPIGNNGKGKLPSVEWFSKDHTNSLVPFYAKGTGSSKFLDVIKGNDDVRGNYIDNSDIGNVIKLLLK